MCNQYCQKCGNFLPLYMSDWLDHFSDSSEIEEAEKNAQQLLGKNAFATEQDGKFIIGIIINNEKYRVEQSSEGFSKALRRVKVWLQQKFSDDINQLIHFLKNHKQKFLLGESNVERD